MNKAVQRERYNLIDALRGAAVIHMVAYHLCYNIFVVFGVWPNIWLSAPAVVWERFICFTFIIMSGISLNFSHHGYRRGAIVSLCGLIVTAVTLLFLPEQAIWCGVLTFLGAAMLLTFALRKALCRIPPAVGMAVFFLLFAFFYGVPQGFLGIFSIPLMQLPEGLYRFRWLAFFGFPPKDFFSSDYFPFLQWIFLYQFGFMLWRWFEQKGVDRFFRRKIPALDFIGRHSLLLYMAHQPVLYGMCWLLFRIIG